MLRSLAQTTLATLRTLQSGQVDPRLRSVVRRFRRHLQPLPAEPPPQPVTQGALRVELGGRIALVTGATGELGRVMVRTLARCGADVAIHYRSNSGAAAQLQAELRELGRRSVVIRGDVGDAAAVAAMLATVRAELGEPDVVVINAVEQIHPWSEVLDEAAADYLSQFNSCVMQTVYLAKETIPAMARKRRGRIIGINTECTMQLAPRMSAYAAGKRGMDGVLRVLAREVGPDGITVNQVAPGWTISDKDRAAAVDDAGYVTQVPLRRRGTDQEIANVVAFLASDLASFVHGVYLPVCGGNVMPAV
jgi:3-oxoacyl-[acyl-carrier protein] reductase